MPTTDAGLSGHDRRWIRTLSDEAGSRSFAAMAAAIAAAEAEVPDEGAADTVAKAAAAALAVAIAGDGAHVSVMAQAAVLAARTRGRHAAEGGRTPDPEIACALAVASAAALGGAIVKGVPDQDLLLRQESAESVANAVASAALAEAILAARAVAATQEVVLTAARTVAATADAAAETVATAVAAKATVVAAAAAAAAAARSTEDRLRREHAGSLSHGHPPTGLPPHAFVRPRRGTALAAALDSGQSAASTKLIAQAVASAAMAEADLAAQAVADTQAAVVTAARTVAEAAASAAQTVAAAVTAKAAVVAAAAADAALARSTEDRLRHDVLHDELTGLTNRRFLMDHLTYALLRASQAESNVTVLYLDVDGFKHVNDELGHAVGDRVLIQLAKQLQQHLRESDTCARVGGDEFVVVLDDAALSRTDGQLVADRIQASLAEGVTVVGAETIHVHVHVSIGVAVSSATSLPHDLLEEADRAMYRVKTRPESARGRLRARAQVPAVSSFDSTSHGLESDAS